MDNDQRMPVPEAESITNVLREVSARNEGRVHPREREPGLTDRWHKDARVRRFGLSQVQVGW